jgi:hypothetical protein
MKRLILCVCLITILILGATSCGGKVALIDSVQSNLGGHYLNPIMETDIGYYFNSTQREMLSLRYFDKETGETVYLCSKPECRHDGSSYCTATNNNIEAMYTALYDNKLYIFGIENNNALTLYRASLDGTEFTRLKKLMEIPKGFRLYEWSDGGFIIHRGRAFIPYNIVNTVDEGDGLVGMFMVNLSSLKCEIVDERSRYSEYDEGIQSIKAAGDYVYYVFNRSNILTQQNPIIKRYNIKNKKTEEIVVPDKNVNSITNFALIGDDVWYSIQINDIGRSYIMIYDTITDKTREFEGELFNTVHENVKYFGYSDIMYDGTYLYVGEECNMYPNYTSPDDPPNIYIYSLDGTRLAGFSHEYAGTFNSISVIDGIVYFQTEKLIDTCSVQDIIDGNIVWKTEVVIDDLTPQ